MDEIDGIQNCNGLKYGIYKKNYTFGFINIDVNQSIGQKNTPLRTRSFLSLVAHLKEFGPNGSKKKIQLGEPKLNGIKT